MAQVINTNVMSLNAQRNLSVSGSQLATSLQRLSSGLRINSAKDDAAGLAISERFTTQIRGLNVAIRNANDGISLAQTAEGALGEISNNLQRIRELAVQSRNATNSASDRNALNAEAQQLKAEIDRVASQTSFNNVKLLDGSFTAQAFQVGADAGQLITIDSITNASSSALGEYTTYSLAGAAIADPTTGNPIADVSGMTIEVDGETYTVGDITGEADDGSGAAFAGRVAAAINELTSQTGVTATVDPDDNSITLTSLKAFTLGGTVTGTGLTAGDGQEATVTGFADLDISTAGGADLAILAMDAALEAVNSARADLGAVQNRFTSVVANLQTTSENLSASRSRILDADFAAETAALTRTQILQQAGTAILAQANQVPQNVLSLLR